MPFAATRSFPLPSLKHYTLFSIVILALSIFLFTKNPPTTEIPAKEGAPLEENATNNTTNNATTSSFPKWPAANMAYCLLLLFGCFARKVLLGELRVGEQQLVREKTMNFIFHKFVFLFGVLNIQDIDELMTWIVWLALVGFFAVWGAMTKMRSEYVCQSPHTSKLTHLKLISMLGAIFGSSVVLFSIALYLEPIETDYTLDYHVFMAAECLVLGLRPLHALTKHCIHIYDEAQPGTWEGRAVFSYYTDLLYEMTILAVEFIHHLHMMIWANVFLSMASLVIFMQIRIIYAEIRKRLDKHRNFVRVSQSLETRFPIATKDQLEGNSDNCAICWDSMESARVLPCGHLFHLSCLRSWLEQDTSCPTCRVNLRERQEPSHEDTGRTLENEPSFLNNNNNNQQVRRRRNDLFRFDGSQYASWLPVLSLQVVRGRGRQNHQTDLERMAVTVQEVLPNFSLDIIMNDLMLTRSADQTVQNLLERHPFQEVMPSSEAPGLRLRRQHQDVEESVVELADVEAGTSSNPSGQDMESTHPNKELENEEEEEEDGTEPSYYQAKLVLPSEIVDSDGEKDYVSERDPSPDAAERIDIPEIAGSLE